MNLPFWRNCGLLTALKEKNKLRNSLPEPTKDEVVLPPTRTLIKSKRGIVRRRVEWSDLENTILLEGIEKKLPSDEIAKQLPIRTEEDIYFHVRHLNRDRLKSSLPPLHLLSRSRLRKETIPTQSEKISTDSSISRTVKTDSSSDSSEDKADSIPSDTSSTPKRRPPPCPRITSAHRKRRNPSTDARKIPPSRKCSSLERFRGKRRLSPTSSEEQ